MMDDLSDFLLARIGEDESAARMATDGPWRVKDRRGDRYVFVAAESAAIASAVRPEDLAHIARHDPARVLAECEAKRRIVELHHISDEDIYDADGTERPGKDCTECWDEFPCGTLRLLALPYADHQDYRDEWRP